MLGPRLTNRDEGRGLGQPVDLRDRPTQLAFDALDRGGRRGRSGGHDADAPARAPPHLFGRAGDADEHGGSRTQHGHGLACHEVEDRHRVDLREADVRRARRRDRPDERPAVGVKHGQRPEVAILDAHRVVEQRADHIRPRVAVRDHHALGPRGRAARVVDRDQVALGERRRRPVEARRRPLQFRFVVQPSFRPGPVEGHDALERRQLPANGLDTLDPVGVGADDAGAAVLQDVLDVVGRQAVVDRDEHGPDLRNRVERLEMGVRVVRERRDAVARTDAEAPQERREAVATLEELAVGEAPGTVDDGLAVGMEPPRPPCELEWRERSLQTGTSERGIPKRCYRRKAAE